MATKTLWVKIEFVALHQTKPADYNSDPLLIADGFLTNVSKYRLESSTGDPGGGFEVNDYSEFRAIPWTFKDPPNPLDEAPYSTEGGIRHYPIWTKVQVPTSYIIPPKSSTDITSSLSTTDDPGFSFTDDNQLVTIFAGVTVSSQANAGVYSDESESFLVNNGTISSDVFDPDQSSFAGVYFHGDAGRITNNAAGTISGEDYGIWVNGEDMAITNKGAIKGLNSSGVVFQASTTNAVLENSGQISGKLSGVLDFGLSDGSLIKNTGTITSDREGIHVWTDGGLKTVIDNAAGATIKGLRHAILTDEGSISVNNRGTISGSIVCDTTANDTIRNTGKITGGVFLGSGTDSFNGASGSAVKVSGEAGNDGLTGSSGADTLTGGLGKDRLYGGNGSDDFDFNTISESKVGSNRDYITHFQRGTDDIDLRSIDAKTGVSGNNAFKFIGKDAFDDVRGELRYKDNGSTCTVQGDVNGDGKADFEILVKAGSLAKGDFLL